jgi:Na+/phosphate symporter
MYYFCLFFGALFILPCLAALINKGELAVLGPAEQKQKNFQSIFNNLRALLIFSVLVLLQILCKDI